MDLCPPQARYVKDIVRIGSRTVSISRMCTASFNLVLWSASSSTALSLTLPARQTNSEANG